MDVVYKDIDDFKKDYFKYGKYDLKKQVPHLASLAQHYGKMYINTGDWKDCLKAHSLYNSLAIRDPENGSWTRKAFIMQQLYWGNNSKLTYETQTQITGTLKESLEHLRHSCRSEMTSTDSLVNRYGNCTLNRSLNSKFCTQMKTASVKCSEMMCTFSGLIIEHSIDILTQSLPCDFQAVAFGSLAKGEATPYSDLEYLFLIENKDSEIERFFEKLAVTSYFLIGNLGETKLSHMAIEQLHGWFDDQGKNGFKIDGLAVGAGNIPTGNDSLGKHNHLIVTPEELAGRYKDVFDKPKKEALKGDLTAMLNYTTTIYSRLTKGKDLLKMFRQQLSSLVPTKARTEMNQAMLQADVKKFHFVPNDDLAHNGFSISVKKELYRFASIIALDLTIFFGITAQSSWEAIDLMTQSHVSQDVGDALKFCLAAAVYIRFSAYLYHDSQDERMSVGQQRQRQRGFTPNSTLSRMRWFMPVGLFSHLWSMMFPLELCLSKLDFRADFNTNEVWSVVIALFFSGRYSQALSALRVLCGDTLLDDPVPAAVQLTTTLQGIEENYHIFYVISEIMFMCREYQAALTLFSYVAKSGESTTHCTYRIAGCLEALGKFDVAIELLLRTDIVFQDYCYHAALAGIYISKESYDKAEQHCVLSIQDEYIMRSYDSLTDYSGNALSQVATIGHDLDLASASPEQRLGILKFATPNITRNLQVLGTIYFAQQRYTLAETYYKRALDFASDVFGHDSADLTTAVTLDHLANLYRKQKKYQRALECGKNALKMYQDYAQEYTGDQLTGLLFKLAEIYQEVEEFNNSDKFISEGLALHNASSKSRSRKTADAHALEGLVYFNRGWILNDKEEPRKAEVYFIKAISAYRQASDDKIFDIAQAFDMLGIVYQKMEQYSKSEQACTFALSRFRKLDQAVRIRGTLVSIGCSYQMLNRYYKANECWSQALALCQEIMGEMESIENADILLNIASHYASNNMEYSEATRINAKALKIYEKLKPDSDKIGVLRCRLSFKPGPVGKHNAANISRFLGRKEAKKRKYKITYSGPTIDE